MKHHLILFFALLFLACGGEKRPADPAQQQRLATLRAQLRSQLGDEYDQPVAGANPAQLQRGAKLYSQLCAACHGQRGTGNGHTGEALVTPPADLTDAEESHFFSEQARLQIIRKGIAGSAMVGWQGVLPEGDILAVYLYIRSLIDKN